MTASLPGNPTPWILRAATASDAPELARLTSQLGYPASEVSIRVRLSRILGTPGVCLFVAEGPGGALAGWVHGFLTQLLESEYRVEIGGLIVDECQRRCGIGRLLVQAVEVWAVKHGAVEVSVRCREERTDSHTFYERLAFLHTKNQRVFRKRLSTAEAR